MSKKEKKLILISVLLSALLVAGSALYFWGSDSVVDDTDASPEQEEPVLPTSPPELGEPGSEHAHISFLLFIDDSLYDLSKEEYIEQSNYAHFHADSDMMIHKHATGVTLPYFLETLDMELAEECLVLDSGRAYCDNSTKQVRMYVNGEEMQSPELYELQHGDKIFLNYGSDSRVELKLKAQSVPDIPPNLLEDYEPPNKS